MPRLGVSEGISMLVLVFLVFSVLVGGLKMSHVKELRGYKTWGRKLSQSHIKSATRTYTYQDAPLLHERTQTIPLFEDTTAINEDSLILTDLNEDKLSSLNEDVTIKPPDEDKLQNTPVDRQPLFQDSPKTLSLTQNSRAMLQDGEGSGEGSRFCGEGCGSDVVVTGTILVGLLQELAKYLRHSHVLIVTRGRQQGLCVWAARELYYRGYSTTCYPYSTISNKDSTTNSTTLPPSHAVLLMAGPEEDGREASDAVVEVWGKISHGGNVPPNLLVLLASPHARLSLPPAQGLHFTLLQPRGESVEFFEVFTFDGDSESTGMTEEYAWSWIPGDDSIQTPYIGDIIAPSNFNGNVVRVAMVEHPPFMMLNKDSTDQLHPTGYLVDVVQLLAQELNFTIRWHETTDGEYGIPKDDGSWTGLVKDLQMNLADLAIGIFSFTQERSVVMDFSPAIDYSSVGILIFSDGETRALDWTTYFTIFHWKVWVVLGGIWLVMAIGLVKVARPSPQITVYNYLFSFAGAFAQQGSEVEPGCTKGRMVFLTLWAGSVLIYTSYTARLTSQLAVVNTQSPFNSMLEALTKADYKIMVQSGTAYITFIQNSRDRGMQVLSSNIKADPSLLFKSDVQGMNKLETSKEKYGMLAMHTPISYLLKGNCSFTWAGPEYFTEYTYLGYRKGLPYANAFNTYIMRATDAGILPKLRAKWWGQHSQSSCLSSSTFNHLGFSKTISAFALLLMGVFLSVGFLIIEYFFHRFGFWDHLNEFRLVGSQRSKRRKKRPISIDKQKTITYEPHLKHLQDSTSHLSRIQ